MMVIAAGLEKDDQGKKNQKMLQRGGGAPPAVDIVKSGVVRPRCGLGGAM